ncbi:MAG: hypothetical protein HQM08_04395 [Candidatus Riflebacteria bacterium]|nr:hypothetical protein [Candidatus Riflebacteria bacterium]
MNREKNLNIKECLKSFKIAGITLIEIAMAMALLAFIIAGSFRAFQVFTGKASRTLSQKLILQMEARKALLSLFHEVQEGIEVVYPQPGSTLPYMLYRDFVNNLRVIYLELDPELSKIENENIYRAMEGKKDLSTGKITDQKLIMRYVKSLNFTAHHNGGVLFTTTLKSANGIFSLVNYVRLKNSAAE